MFLKRDIFAALKDKSKFSLPVSYWLLVILRYLLTALPQNGYIHPDEFFQNMEVISSDVFYVDTDKTWEFNTTFPIRNIFIPKITFGPPFMLIKAISPYAKYYFNLDLRSPYYLLVIPRLLLCTLSLVNDYCLYQICLTYGHNYKNRLKIFASSYVVIVFCCRSFSNSIEMALFSLLLMIVAQCMYKSDKIIYHEQFINEKYHEAKSPVDKVKLYKLKTHLPEHSLQNAVYIATISVIGFFNRPTFIVYAMPPIFFWLNRGLGSKVVSLLHFHQRMLLLIVYAIPSIVILIMIDSVYYGYFTFVELESLKITLNNYVVTPLNFLRYNLNRDNLEKHGLHPRWLHFLVNVPLLFNIIGLIGLFNLAKLTLRFCRGEYKNLPRIQSITGLMLFSFVAPTALLSIFPHQEARFIIPVLLPLVFLHGNDLFPIEAHTNRWRTIKSVMLKFWFLTNIFMTFFFGFLHQGGIYPLTKHYSKELKSTYATEMHLFTSHMYSIPTSLLQIESTSKTWYNKATGHKYKLAKHHYFHEHGSMELENLLYTIQRQVEICEDNFNRNKKMYRVYLALPCSLENKVLDIAHSYTDIKLYKEAKFYPHLSTEALPLFPKSDDGFCFNDVFEYQSPRKKLNLFERSVCFMSKFCLSLIKVKNTQ